MYDLSGLQKLQLAMNQLEGELSQDLAQLVGLRELTLYAKKQPKWDNSNSFGAVGSVERAGLVGSPSVGHTPEPTR